MTSGELTGDFSASVTYGALAFYPAAAFTVGAEDQRKLLASARQTLNRYLADKTKSPVPVPPAERSAALRQRAGVFVTIKKNGELRGCVGNLAASQPLWQNVPDRTLAATTADPRFPPLSADEGPVTLEISLLTPLKKLGGWQELRPGKGAVLVLEGKAATLLPQVAAEMGWSRDQLLENLARKAGLAPSAYRHPRARLYVFEAQVFAESAAETDGHSRRGQ
jgi:AmmeMemoRadiSam system protein A